ncbi:MAG TPA: FAD binding domain-containing protein [Actinospica sp.]|nr:FAD binding domain-containing protein [Actinospica sp.]
MKPAPFTYHRPGTIEDALGLLARYGGDAMALAGGQSLVPRLNARQVRPEALVDINRIAGLDGACFDGRTLRVGAMSRLCDLERDRLVRAHAPALAQAAALVGHPQIRTQATIGGSLCHADPAAELPVLCLALGATLHLRAASGARQVEAGEFFRAPHRTALVDGELLVAIDFEPSLGFGWFEEVSLRAHDRPLVCAAVDLAVTDGVVTAARIAAGGVADRPVRLTAAAQALIGHAAPDAAQAAADAAAAEVAPPATFDAPSAYRRAQLRTVVRRALVRIGELVEAS